MFWLNPKGGSMARDPKEDFFRLDGAWASFELMSIRKREDYLKPFRVLRCKIDDQVDFQIDASVQSTTEATVLIEIFGEEELVAASGRGPAGRREFVQVAASSRRRGWTPG